MDTMLSKVSQAEKDKSHEFSLIHGRQSQKINIHTKTNRILQKLIM
jgi:hypothetical protein